MPSKMITVILRHPYRVGRKYGLVMVLHLCAVATSVSAQSTVLHDSIRRDSAQTSPIPASSAQGERVEALSFDQYRVASGCVAAAHREELLFWRTRRMDTIGPATQNRWQDKSLQTARTCAQRFPLDSMPAHELLAAFELMLITGDEAGAISMAERYLRTGDASRRAFRLYQVITKLVTARPARADIAIRYAYQLDSLGPTVAGWRTSAYANLVDRIAFDWNVPLLTGVVQRGLEAFALLPDSSRLQWAEDFSRLASVNALLASEGPGGITETMDIVTRSSQILAPIRPDLARALASSAYYKMRGAFAERLEGVWANVATGDTLRPPPGRLSLVVFTSHRCSWYCYPGLSVLRRLTAGYFNNDSTAVTLVLAGEGMFRLQGTSIPLEEELQKATAQYVVDERLKAGIVMAKAPVDQIPDGRYLTKQTVNEMRYNIPNAGVLGILVDRDGNIHRAMPINPNNEAYWKSVLSTIQNTQSPRNTATGSAVDTTTH